MDKACYQPGWKTGPAKTGGERRTFLCELPGDHNGQHEWVSGGKLVQWPVDKREKTPDGD
jgi:hypothetical protein